MQQNKLKGKFTILGSGTSSGVPVIGCRCACCRSTDPHDKRLRASLLVQTDDVNIVIDTSPDFRAQMLKNDIGKVDCILYTHPHFDHIGGFDEIRSLNFSMHKKIDIRLNQFTYDNLRKTFHYAFEKPKQLGGGIPQFNIKIIDANFTVGGIEFIPINMFHGIMSVTGYRFGNFAYLTDTNNIPESEFSKLQNLKTVIIDGLRFTQHPTHYSIMEAINTARKFSPEKIIITHLTHNVIHADTFLPEDVELAYDGMTGTFEYNKSTAYKE